VAGKCTTGGYFARDIIVVVHVVSRVVTTIEAEMNIFLTIVRRVGQGLTPTQAHRPRRRATRAFFVLPKVFSHTKRLQAAEVAVEGRSPPQLGLLPWTTHPTITYTLSSGLK
jgi:hypothetical protein